MDAGFAALMITVVVLLSGTAINIASLWTRRHQPGPGRTELSARVEAVDLRTRGETPEASRASCRHSHGGQHEVPLPYLRRESDGADARR